MAEPVVIKVRVDDPEAQLRELLRIAADEDAPGRQTFWVIGTPRPGGSKTPRLIRRKGGEIVMKNGRPLITMRDDAKGNKTWKQIVSFWARCAMEDRPPHTGPLLVLATFHVPRPKTHYGEGKRATLVKDSAPAFHAIRPDALKLMRSTEDAMIGIVYHDDGQIVASWPSKAYTNGEAGASITVIPLTRR